MLSTFIFQMKEMKFKEVKWPSKSHTINVVQGLTSFDAQIYAFSFCITMPPFIFGFYFQIINSIKVFWRFLIFKCNFMENSKLSKHLCSTRSRATESDLRAFWEGHWRHQVRKQKSKMPWYLESMKNSLSPASLLKKVTIAWKKTTCS